MRYQQLERFINKPILILIVFCSTVAIAIYFLFNHTGDDLGSVTKANLSGDFSLCEKLDTYRYMCIATTELHKTLPVSYNCSNPDSCDSPQCFSYIDCGFSNTGTTGNQTAGCPIQSFCTVDQVWICEETGGVVQSKIKETKLEFIRLWGGNNFCSCPSDKVFIDGYGCASCDSFEHDETRQFCENAKTWNSHPYFTKSY